MADIDIAIFPKKASQIPTPSKFTKIEGIEVQCWWADYETELTTPWDMSKRWTYSQRQIYYDPQGKIVQLLEEINNQLVADMKWRYYCVEKLARLPNKFQERIKEIMILHAISLEELGRRKEIFIEMWREMLPIIEQEVQLTFDEMEQLV